MRSGDIDSPQGCSEQPLVSVIIAAFNSGRFIRPAVSSILNQTYPRLELVIVDDGSADGTPDILKSLAGGRVKILTQPNRGISAALNAGIAASCGELVAFMGHDDVSYPARIARQVEYLKCHGDCGLLGTQFEAIDDTGAVLGPHLVPLTHEDIVDELRTRGNCIGSPSIMVRRSVLQDVGGFRGEFDFAEDYDFILRVSESWQVANLPEMLLEWRRLDTGVTNAHSSRQDALARAARECARRRLAGLPEDMEACVRDALRSTAPERKREGSRERWTSAYLVWGVNYFSLGQRQRAIKALLNSLRLNPFQLRAAVFVALALLPRRTGTWTRSFIARQLSRVGSPRACR